MRSELCLTGEPRATFKQVVHQYMWPFVQTEMFVYFCTDSQQLSVIKALDLPSTLPYDECMEITSYMGAWTNTGKFVTYTLSGDCARVSRFHKASIPCQAT